MNFICVINFIIVVHIFNTLKSEAVSVGTGKMCACLNWVRVKIKRREYE